MDEEVEYLTAAPSPQLAPFIDGYVGYRLSGFAPGLHRGLPSRHMTFIVSIGPSIDVVSQTDPRQAGASYGCVVGGLNLRPDLPVAQRPQGGHGLHGREREVERGDGVTPGRRVDPCP